jgi:SRSO17 transposase
MYLSGQLRQKADRTFTGIAEESGVAMQNMQHFMSNSPWSAAGAMKLIQADIAGTSGLERGGVLLIDESADEKAGDGSAGSGRQYNGRLGKVDMCQVGVFASYAHVKQGVWTWVDAELFLPEACFAAENTEKRKRLGIPDRQRHATKTDLAWAMIQRAQANGLPFEMVAFDGFYGVNQDLRRVVNQAGLIDMADVAHNTQVYLTQPSMDRWDGTHSHAVRDVSNLPDTTSRRILVRATEQGQLNDVFLIRRVWTAYQRVPRAEWLVVREERNGKRHYALCNAPADTSFEQLADWRCQRYFVERSIQDAKDEMGYAEFCAQKYLAWQHHAALTALATWFVAQTKYEWSQKFARDPRLLEEFEMEILPALSTPNIRLMLRAKFPLNQLSPHQAEAHVVDQLIRRARSRKSHLNPQFLM